MCIRTEGFEFGYLRLPVGGSKGTWFMCGWCLVKYVRVNMLGLNFRVGYLGLNAGGYLGYVR